MNLVFLGPPGCGKGTQAARVGEKFGIVSISSGQMLRAAGQRKTQLGQMAKGYIDAGRLVPDDVVIGIIRERLGKPDCRRGYILDGFPRTLAQAQALEKMLEDLAQQIDAVVNFSIPEEELIRRLSGRRLCRKCGQAYHLQFAPPARGQICDKCGGKLIQRNDDLEETVVKRLKVYREQTRPLVDYYASRGCLKNVDGSGDIEAVLARIMVVLGMSQN